MREHGLLEDCRGMGGVRGDALTLGDVLISFEEKPRLMIERKTVRDLVASLRDGRYHDQRRRWKDFQADFPGARVALWIEGDLMDADVDEKTRESLVNSLMRLQSIHRVIICQWRDRSRFVRGLVMAMKKIARDPNHLVGSEEAQAAAPKVLDMGNYKKTRATVECVWRSVLSLVPGVSPATAAVVCDAFPTLPGFIDLARSDPASTRERLAGLRLSAKRRLGQSLAGKICDLLAPVVDIKNDLAESECV